MDEVSVERLDELRETQTGRPRRRRAEAAPAEEMPPAAPRTRPPPLTPPRSRHRQAQPAPPTDQPASPQPPRGERWRKPAGPVRDAKYWALEGVRSLPIDLQKQGDEITFQSLGVRPLLRVTIANGRRIDVLAWSVGLAVFAVGLLLTRRCVRHEDQVCAARRGPGFGLAVGHGLDLRIGRHLRLCLLRGMLPGRVVPDCRRPALAAAPRRRVSPRLASGLGETGPRERTGPRAPVPAPSPDYLRRSQRPRRSPSPQAPRVRPQRVDRTAGPVQAHPPAGGRGDHPLRRGTRHPRSEERGPGAGAVRQVRRALESGVP